MVGVDEKAEREKTQKTKVCWEEAEDLIEDLYDIKTLDFILNLLKSSLRTLRSAMV